MNCDCTMNTMSMKYDITQSRKFLCSALVKLQVRTDLELLKITAECNDTYNSFFNQLIFEDSLKIYKFFNSKSLIQSDTLFSIIQ